MTDSNESQRAHDWPGRAIALCAFAMTALVGYREFRPARTIAAPTRNPVPLENPRVVDSVGHRLGAADAIVPVVAFVDYECPACRGYHATLEDLLARYPREVSISYAHFPLRQHRFAVPSARAVECARAQGRFTEMQSLLYSKQDSLGLKSWRSYASEAGIEDLDRFDACATSNDRLSVLERDTSVALAIGAPGTPTIVVGGFMWPDPPTRKQWDSILTTARARRGTDR